MSFQTLKPTLFIDSKGVSMWIGDTVANGNGERHKVIIDDEIVSVQNILIGTIERLTTNLAKEFTVVSRVEWEDV